jgi:hypothetical protein
LTVDELAGRALTGLAELVPLLLRYLLVEHKRQHVEQIFDSPIATIMLGQRGKNPLKTPSCLSFKRPGDSLCLCC